MTKISIIIPVYNVSEYIGNCLDSILSQSLRDIEVICVNDGSSDNSAEILHKYEKSDNRIIVIDKENQGSGMARNAGLAIAKGKYILFVDGDDWLENNALEKIFKKAEEADTDILIFGGLSYYENIGKNGGYSASKLPKKYLNRIFSAKDIKKDIFKFPSTCWTKLYKKDFLTANNILFQDIKAGQDQLPFFHSMICAKRIALYPENIYCYRKNRCGAVTAVKKKNNFSPIYVFYAVEQLLNNKKLTEEYKEIFINKYFSKATSWLAKFDSEAKDEYFEEYKKLHSHIIKNYPDGWWTKFHPQINDGYYKLKLKQIFAKIFRI